MNNIEPKFCVDCGTSLPQGAKFCSQCGLRVGAAAGGGAGHAVTATQSVARRPFSLSQGLAIGVIAAGLWGIGWYTQNALAGRKPEARPGSVAGTSVKRSGHSDVAPLNDPALNELRAKVKKSPADLAAHKDLVDALIEKTKSLESPPGELLVEIVGELDAILRQSPNDKDALLTMADVAFNQQIFDKSADLYRRYLALVPTDQKTRSRYASCLTFQGKLDEAQAELQTILAKDPNDFEANAYLSITYAQKGDTAKALSLGDKVLSLAPSDEARERFADFLSSLQSKSADGTPAPAQPAASIAAAPSDSPLVEFLRTHPIAGPKFVRVEEAGETLKLIFREFPMEAMPPFVKEKFLTTIKTKAQGVVSQKMIVFIDDANGSEMASIDLTKMPGNSR